MGVFCFFFLSFLFRSIHRLCFEVFCLQLCTDIPNKGMSRKCLCTALTSWSPTQLQARGAVRKCMWHVCVFAAEPTKLWPWRSLWRLLLQVECRNYIRTLHRVNDTTMYVCGTNAFSPTCDYMVSTGHEVSLGHFQSSICGQHNCVCGTEAKSAVVPIIWLREHGIMWLSVYLYNSNKWSEDALTGLWWQKGKYRASPELFLMLCKAKRQSVLQSTDREA